MLKRIIISQVTYCTFLRYLPGPHLRQAKEQLTHSRGSNTGSFTIAACQHSLSCKCSILQQKRPHVQLQGHILQLPTSQVCLIKSSNTSLGITTQFRGTEQEWITRRPLCTDAHNTHTPHRYKSEPHSALLNKVKLLKRNKEDIYMYLPMHIKTYLVHSPLPVPSVHFRNAPGLRWHSEAEHIRN